MYEKLIKALRNVSEYDSGYAKLMYDAADAIEVQDRRILTLQNEMMAEAESHIAEVNRLNKQIEVISKMEKTTQWIPVTERLPEEDGRYLTLYPLKTKPIVWRHKVYGFAKDLVEVDKYEFNEHKSGFYGYDDEYGYYEDTDVTHWMPLPEPPKEESNGV